MTHPRFEDLRDRLPGLSKREQYKLILTTVEWIDFRNKILFSDGFRCAECGETDGPIEKEIPYNEWKIDFDRVAEYNSYWKKFARENPKEIIKQILEGNYSGQMPSPSRTVMIGQRILQVHHKLYFEDKLPWEYSKRHLVSLCSRCHEDVHFKETIYTYQDEGMRLRRVEKKCSKCGGTGYLPEFDHWCNGICFECGGLGFNPDDPSDWEEVTD